MADLYLLFFVVGLLLFAAIVAYSLYQQKRRARDADDLLHAEVASEEALDIDDSPRLEPSLSSADAERAVANNTVDDFISPSVSDQPDGEIVSELSVDQVEQPHSEPERIFGSSVNDELLLDVSAFEEPARQVSDNSQPNLVVGQQSISAPESESVVSDASSSEPTSKSATSVEQKTNEAQSSKTAYGAALGKARSAVERIKRTAVNKSKSQSKAEPKAQPLDSQPTSFGSAGHTQSGSADASGSNVAPTQKTSESAAHKKQEPRLNSSREGGSGLGGRAPKGASSEPRKVFSENDSVVTDLVARVLNPNPIEQSDLLSLFREHDYKFSRKVHIYGLNELTDMWRDIEFELPSARFLELGISIQLCDREGAMSEKEGHDFQQMVLQFCERYDAPFEFSIELDAALEQAQALDQVGRRYDSMAVLNVVPKSKSGFRMADIQSCARDLMMSTDKNGIFMKTEGQKNNITVLYRLACTDDDGHFGIRAVGQAAATPVFDLVVYMNVPATKDPEMVFQQMVKDANDLATWLDGKVVDRTGKAMTQRTYSTLMQQISDIAYSMQQDGLAPGDAVAKKLF